MKSVCDLVTSDRVDIVVAAMVGFSGLAPTMSAISAGKVIALANKETLVAAGSIVMGLSRKYHAPILPVDSEHSAIFQCLLAAQGNAIRKIHLTASGGPFRTWDKSRITTATKEMALRHPNWAMGAKTDYQLSHNDEQRIRSDRGTVALRHPGGQDQRHRPSRVYHSLHGRI